LCGALAAIAPTVAPVVATAQTVPTPPTSTSAAEETAALLAPIPHSQKNPLLKPTRDYGGLPMGDWLFFPSVTAGVTFDDNLVWSSRKPVSATGFRLAPELIGIRDAGIHKTTVYGEVDARLYPSVQDSTAVSARAGLAHAWEIQRDLLFKAHIDYDHRSTHTGSTTGSGGDFTTLAMPLAYDRVSAAASLNKSFGTMFIGLAAETVKTTYNDNATTPGRAGESFRDSWTTTGTMRGGAWVSPALYVFSQVAGNIRDYGEGSDRSHGYQVVAGVGSDRISLFRGEVYGGVQQQFYNSGPVKDVLVPVFGGKLFWYPTRDITLRMSLDQTFTDARLVTPTNPVGHPERMTLGQISLKYQIARDWEATVRGGYSYSHFIGTGRRDQAWRAGVTVFHELSRNLGLTLDYDFSRIISSQVAAGYTRNSVTLGLKYRY